jgi:hypothetical protein
VADAASISVSFPVMSGDAESKAGFELLEVGLVTDRDRGVFLSTVFMRVFSTHIFWPVAEHSPVGFGRGPNGSKDAGRVALVVYRVDGEDRCFYLSRSEAGL